MSKIQEKWLAVLATAVIAISYAALTANVVRNDIAIQANTIDISVLRTNQENLVEYYFNKKENQWLDYQESLETEKE